MSLLRDTEVSRNTSLRTKTFLPCPPLLSFSPGPTVRRLVLQSSTPLLLLLFLGDNNLQTSTLLSVLYLTPTVPFC